MFEPVGAPDLTGEDADGLLRFAASARHAQQQAEVDLMASFAAWARLHGTPTAPTAARSRGDHGETLVRAGGDGTCWVAEFAVAEIAAVLGMSTGQGRVLLADAVDLIDRLPAVWSRVLAGEVPVWKARRVADKTRHLSRSAAAQVDADIAAVAGRLPVSRLDKVVRAAVIEAEPEQALAESERAAADRGVWVGEPGEDGNTEIFIRTDTATALRFEAAVNAIAVTLTDGVLSRDQRRAAAVGLLTASSDTPPATLYVHINQATLTGQAHVARVEGAGPVVADQARGWLSGCQVTIKPVIDLNDQTPVDNYETPLSMRERVLLRTPVDAFPYGTCSSRSQDLDHTNPYDPTGPPGQTRPDNLAPLTRAHHRIKTHAAGWRVAQPFNGVLLWRTPHGRYLVVDHTGTQPLPLTG